MRIRYVHHSGFIIDDGAYALMIDCCGLTKESAEVRDCAGKYLYILASHIHGDHFDQAIMSFRDPQQSGAKQKWILSTDIQKKVKQRDDVHFIRKGDTFRDARVIIKAYGSTDEGVSFYIEAGGKKLFHAGDLNNWHWDEEASPENAAKYERNFLDELSPIAREHPVLDAAMFPVDPRLGKNYTRGAEQFLDSIKTGLFIPMHFWDNLEAAMAFKPSAEQRGCRFAGIRAAGDVFEV